MTGPPRLRYVRERRDGGRSPEQTSSRFSRRAWAGWRRRRCFAGGVRWLVVPVPLAAARHMQPGDLIQGDLIEVEWKVDDELKWCVATFLGKSPSDETCDVEYHEMQGLTAEMRRTIFVDDKMARDLGTDELARWRNVRPASLQLKMGDVIEVEWDVDGELLWCAASVQPRGVLRYRRMAGFGVEKRRTIFMNDQIILDVRTNMKGRWWRPAAGRSRPRRGLRAGNPQHIYVAGNPHYEADRII